MLYNMFYDFEYNQIGLKFDNIPEQNSSTINNI